MDPDFPFKGQPRRWFAYPFVVGLILIALGLIFLKIDPVVLAKFVVRAVTYLLAVICVCVGVVLTLVGLDLSNNVTIWNRSIRIEKWRAWMKDHWRGPGGNDRS